MEFGERMTKEVQMVRKEFAHRSAKVEDKVEIPEALVDSPRKASRGTNNAKAKDASFYCCVGPTAHKDEEFALMSSWEVLMKCSSPARRWTGCCSAPDWGTPIWNEAERTEASSPWNEHVTEHLRARAAPSSSCCPPPFPARCRPTCNDCYSALEDRRPKRS